MNSPSTFISISTKIKIKTPLLGMDGHNCQHKFLYCILKVDDMYI